MINPLGRIIRAQGRMINPLGRIIRAQGRMINPLGRIIPELGRIISELGRMINPLGRINETHSKNPNKKGPKIGPSLLLLTKNCFVKQEQVQSNDKDSYKPSYARGDFMVDQAAHDFFITCKQDQGH